MKRCGSKIGVVGIVESGVLRIKTPGFLTESVKLDNRENNPSNVGCATLEGCSMSGESQHFLS